MKTYFNPVTRALRSLHATLLFAVILAAAFMAVAPAHAASMRIKMTQVFYGKFSILEWSGTKPAATGDSIFLEVDTTNHYGADPSFFLYTKRVTVGQDDKVYPREGAPKSLCMNMNAKGKTDSVRTLITERFAKTQTGTYRLADAVQTFKSPAANALEVIMHGKFIFEPGGWPVWKMVATSGSDSLYPTYIKIWACDE